ncbi:heavy-metal-associated domain-containing protein [Microbacterium sp. NPDC078428]|uniref:heavy-metal-associated domain-containing protein n=1 Tax=Microbacterium sp. NPDC078428 TaxID=3364190 RepID=UPI0037C818B4
MTTTELFVSGMTCAHCVASVSEEIGEIPGVDAVDVDLRAGEASRVRVTSAAPVDAAALREAVEEAGYTLTGAPA